jgi:hypothetical protein
MRKRRRRWLCFKSQILRLELARSPAIADIGDDQCDGSKGELEFRVPLTFLDLFTVGAVGLRTGFPWSNTMRNRIDIDLALRCAIAREIGEGLRASLREDELPASLKDQLDRLRQLDDQSQPTVPDTPSKLRS